MNDKGARLEAKRRRERIDELKFANPDWNARQIHDKLKEEFEDNVQSLNAVQKQIAKRRPEFEKTKGLDVAWQIGDLTSPGHELNPEVVPILVAEQDRRIRENESRIIVRQAMWASRLYSTIASLLGKNKKAIPESVVHWSEHYTVFEKWAAYKNQLPLNTSELDAALVRQPDMSLATWLKDRREGKPGSVVFPPAPLGGFLPLPVDVNFAKRDKIRKEREAEKQKWRENDNQAELDGELPKWARDEHVTLPKPSQLLGFAENQNKVVR